MMDFSGSAGAGSDFDIMPKGFLAWAYLAVRGVKKAASGGSYIDCELTIAEGQPYAGRKLWEMIGQPFDQANSEKYRQMGMLAITRILEAGRGAGPNNPAGYKIDDFSQLNGLKVPIKVGVEEGSGGHDDKNRVAEWLTPNPASASGNKPFVKLTSGDHGLQQNTQAPANGFGGGAQVGNGGASGFGAQSSAVGNGGGFGGGGFGQQQPQQQTGGFGGTGSGFQQAPADQTTGAGAISADSQSQNAGANAAHSDPGATPNWLSQAGGAAQQ